jgi:hypothetical protein
MTGSTSDHLDSLAGLVAKAGAGDAHLALGYKSWTEYVSTEFAVLSLRLDRDDRRELVTQLSGEGMSTRAIAPIAGVDRKTVERDISGGTNVPPVENPAPDAKVIGIDGKTYTRKSSKPRAVPLPDRSWRKAFDVVKGTEQLRHLTDDRRRYGANSAVITDDAGRVNLPCRARVVTPVESPELR